MTIRAVVFDLGHTIWDIKRDDAVMRSLARAYVEMHASLARDGGPDHLPDAGSLQRAVRDVLRRYAVTYEDDDDLSQPPTWSFVAEAFDALDLAVDEATLRAITPPLFATEIEGLICSDGTCETIAELVGGAYAVGCITNTLADTDAIRAMLERFGIARYMRSVVVSADEGWRKPHFSLFEKSLRELAVSPSEALFVGDSPRHDIAGAKAAGMWAALSRQYVAREVGPHDVKADGAIDHVRELFALIERLDEVAARSPAR